jgi:hypothetical protein
LLSTSIRTAMLLPFSLCAVSGTINYNSLFKTGDYKLQHLNRVQHVKPHSQSGIRVGIDELTQLHVGVANVHTCQTHLAARRPTTFHQSWQGTTRGGGGETHRRSSTISWRDLCSARRCATRSDDSTVAVESGDMGEGGDESCWDHSC